MEMAKPRHEDDVDARKRSVFNDVEIMKAKDLSPLSSEGSINEQCEACSLRLDLLGQTIHNASDRPESIFVKTIMQPTAARLQDLRLRLDIWKSDLETDGGVVDDSEAFKKSSLHSGVSKAFERIRSKLADVGTECSNLRTCLEHCSQDEFVSTVLIETSNS